MTGSARYTHLIGALTAPSADEAMATALQYLGPTLLSLPDGENPTGQFPTRHRPPPAGGAGRLSPVCLASPC